MVLVQLMLFPMVLLLVKLYRQLVEVIPLVPQ
jgi:hypothetical protein